MTQSDLLRFIADAGNGAWILPASIDGLRTGETPCLRFHDVPLASVAPWLDALKAKTREQLRYSNQPYPGYQTVTVWRGRHLALMVDIKLYESEWT